MHRHNLGEIKIYQFLPFRMDCNKSYLEMLSDTIFPPFASYLLKTVLVNFVF